jgi:ABC-2 type transport system permease protein
MQRYLKVFGTFARNSLVRDMTFRANFIIEIVSSLAWMGMYLGFYWLIFQNTPAIGGGDDAWTKWQFFAFLATSMLINGIVEGLFMPNTEELSELIRTGGLDFALLKPIDTQFLVSLHRVDWSSLANIGFAVSLLSMSLVKLQLWPTPVQWVLYPLYLLCGVGIFYSLMITLAATSIWLGRNQTLYALPNGNLQWHVRCAATQGIYVCAARVVGGQHSRTTDRAPAARPKLAAGAVCPIRHSGESGDLAHDLPVGTR